LVPIGTLALGSATVRPFEAHGSRISLFN